MILTFQNPGIHDIVDIVARDESGEKRFKAMVRFDADADIRYYRRVEFYQWLLERN